MFKLRHIPNLLTMLRLVLATGFFVLLARYQFDQEKYGLLLPAIGLFILAALTDALDGMLARRWEAESKFGRVMDPFCDKVLVLGALCFLAGPGFVYQEPVFVDNMYEGERYIQVSGFLPWMVVVILARELLVTGIRGELEGTGHKFGANLWGKLKMALQSAAVPFVLLVVYLTDSEFQFADKLQTPLHGMVYATVAVTVLSGLPYAIGAYRVVNSERGVGKPES
ncbi:MAG: CDP-alcohol phosphatidyltransferase family protein [Planctomycetota bacterium]